MKLTEFQFRDALRLANAMPNPEPSMEQRIAEERSLRSIAETDKRVAEAKLAEALAKIETLKDCIAELRAANDDGA